MWLKAIKLLHYTKASVLLTKQNIVLISSESTKSCQYKSWELPQTHPPKISARFYNLQRIFCPPIHQREYWYQLYPSLSTPLGPLHTLPLINKLFSCNVIILYEVNWVQWVLLMWPWIRRWLFKLGQHLENSSQKQTFLYFYQLWHMALVARTVHYKTRSAPPSKKVISNNPQMWMRFVGLGMAFLGNHSWDRVRGTIRFCPVEGKWQKWS